MGNPTGKTASPPLRNPDAESSLLKRVAGAIKKAIFVQNGPCGNAGLIPILSDFR